MTSTVPASLFRTNGSSALQAVFLDMDGTLVDTEGFWWDAEVEVFADLGHRLDEAWRDIVVGGPMTRSAGYLIESTGADITVAELTVLLNEKFERRIERGVPLMPGAERLLAELSRTPSRPRWSPPRTGGSSTRSSTRSAATASPSPSRGTRSYGPSRTRSRI